MLFLFFVYKLFNEFLFGFCYKCEKAGFWACDICAMSHTILWIST